MTNIREFTDHNLYSPSRAEIDLNQLKANLAAIADRCGRHVKLMAVVKADAYGHGAERIARAAIACGADSLAVANVSEGVALRDSGIQSMILILGVIAHKSIPALFDYDLTPSITSIDEANLIDEYGKSINRICKVHVRVDIGNRSLGIQTDQSLEQIQAMNRMTHLQIDGIYTHLPAAYADDLTIAKNDLIEFNELLLHLQKLGIFIPIVHASSSPAILTLPDAHYNLVRCGIIMYGLPAINNQPHILIKPIMQIKSAIVAYKQIELGSFFGYANKYVADKQIRLAIIPFGYGDGSFMFHLRHGEVLIRGVRATIIGQIYMDHFLVDVSDFQTEVGDEVVILGGQGSDCIAAIDIAERASIGRLNSDFVCLLSQRVPRIYIEE
ncbi:MAG: alanine racemase [Paenibacillaceae bacterium]